MFCREIGKYFVLLNKSILSMHHYANNEVIDQPTYSHNWLISIESHTCISFVIEKSISETLFSLHGCAAGLGPCCFSIYDSLTVLSIITDLLLNIKTD